MQRRGELIRSELPVQIKPNIPSIALQMGPTGLDLGVDGRDGTGQKNEIPWVRLFSRSRSPSAQEGWYCVYLFCADGSGAYLSLGHGSTRYEDGEFKPRPPSELAKLLDWARAVLDEKLANVAGLSPAISLKAKGRLGKGYEPATVCSIFYPTGSVPADELLVQDLTAFAALLSDLYNQEDLGRAPESNANAARIAENLVETIASPLRSNRGVGQGFGLTLDERRAVEKHAMAMAEKFLLADGYVVEDVSGKRSYDFLAKRFGKETIVEVKGTTGGLGSIILTANEVLIHQKSYPNNALVVVHSIELDRKARTPRASGGALHTASPWDLDPSALKPLSFQYVLSEV